MAALFNDVTGRSLPQPFPRLTYAEAMDRFGLDKPDTRFGLELKDVSDIVGDSGFKVFASVVNRGGIVKAFNAKGCIDFSRKEIDDLTAFVAVYRAKGLAWIKVREDAWQSPIAKFFTDAEKARLAERIDMPPGDLVFFVADQPKVANEALGHLRNHLGKRLGLIDDSALQIRLGHPFPHVRIRRRRKTLPGPAPPLYRPPGSRLRPAGNRSAGGAFARLRSGAQRLRNRRRQHPYPRRTTAAAGLCRPGDARRRLPRKNSAFCWTH